MAEGETTEQKFELLALREDKKERKTEYVGLNGEHGIGFSVLADTIHWETNENLENARVTIQTTDYGEVGGIGSQVWVEGPRVQLEQFLRGLGLSTLHSEQTPKSTSPDTV